MLTALLLSIPLFIATNLDDLFLLLAFFAHRRLKSGEVVVGQYLGIAALIVASALLALAARSLASAWVGLLGLIPVGLGLRELLARENDEVAEGESAARRAESTRRTFHVLAVAGVTVANGADNLGAWVPVYAVSSVPEQLVITAAFLVMTGLLCAGARWLVVHPRLGAPLRRHGTRLLPWVLIAVGVAVLLEAGTLAKLVG